MRSALQKETPKAARTAKGAGIASVGTIATAGAYRETGRGRKRKRIEAIGPHGRFAVTGQVAKTLQKLATAGERGVTALEANSWAYRLSHYVYELRHRYGLRIDMAREPHDGGWHGRYVLHCRVAILEPGQ